MYKVGLGQDSHQFATNKRSFSANKRSFSANKRSFSANKKPLILGGVKIVGANGLAGNSDGDVILHSLCNALSSAIGGDSLSTWADEMLHKKGIGNSQKYIEYIFQKVKREKYKIENVSICIEAKKPHLQLETIKKIKEKIASLLEINIKQVGITFTSGEGLTPFGQGKGVQSFSMVFLRNISKGLT